MVILGRQQLDYLVVFREAAALLFRENLPAVDGDIVDAAAAGNQDDFGTGKFFAQIGLQTGGTGQVVSAPAIGDFNFHLALRYVIWLLVTDLFILLTGK